MISRCTTTFVIWSPTFPDTSLTFPLFCSRAHFSQTQFINGWSITHTLTWWVKDGWIIVQRLNEQDSHLHCVGFTGSSLAVGKNTLVVSVYAGRDQSLHLTEYLQSKQLDHRLKVGRYRGRLRALGTSIEEFQLTVTLRTMTRKEPNPMQRG